MKDRLLLVITICVSVCGSWANVGGAEADKRIVRLVSQLSASGFGTREETQKQLLLLGRSAEDALREALKDKDLNREARERIDYILYHLDIPEAGVVWRGRKGHKPPPGIKDGDVLTAIDGRRVSAWHVFWHLGGEDVSIRRLTVWRKGKGTFELSVPFGGKVRSGFNGWSDWLEKYRLYGHKGRWDAKVSEAIRLDYQNKPAFPELKLAWKDGCRDALVALLYIKTLRRLEKRADAEKLIKVSLDDLKGDYPGGRYRYGFFPYEVVGYLISTGQRKRAEGFLKEAEEKANKACAWQGLPALRIKQAQMNLTASPAEAVAFWNRHASEIRTNVNLHLLVTAMAEHLASEGDPGKALAFLKKEPDSPVVRRLKPFYVAQVRLAARSKGTQVAPYKILVKYVPYLGPIDYPRWRTSARTQAFPSPGSVECEMRLARPIGQPAWSGGGNVSVRLRLDGEEISMQKHQDGDTFQVDVDTPANLRAFRPISHNPFAWTDVSIEELPHLTRVRFGGREYRTVYHSSPMSGTLTAIVSVKNCGGEFRNIRCYVRSSVKVDNDALERLFKDRYKAIKAGNLGNALRQHNILLKQLTRVPEAGSVCAEMRQDMHLFEAIMSKKGLTLCTPRMLRRALANVVSFGNWELRNGWITCRTRWGGSSALLVIPMLVPDDIEVTGIIEVLRPVRNTFVSFNWNCATHGCKTKALLFPHRREAKLGGWYRKYKETKKVDFSSPLPFCIRTRGDKAALFLRFGAKPDLQLSGLKRTGDNFIIRTGWMSEKTRVRISKLLIRHLPKDTPLDSPVHLPTTKPTSDKQEW
ncbi:MAG: hypothetical protein KAV00_00470 [Phycisphaerae bacterium]|nr:hypothetical protein [Phycisphaerae bacterium]